MNGVGVAVQQTDRDAFVLAASQRGIQTFRQLVDIQRIDDGPVCVDALGNFEGVRAPDDRFRLGVEQIVDLPAIVPLQQQNVAEPLGDQKRDGRALAFQHGVQRNRRTVRQIADGVDWQGGGVDGGQRAFIGSRRCAGHLGNTDGAVVDGDQIGEGAADLDADAQGGKGHGAVPEKMPEIISVRKFGAFIRPRLPSKRASSCPP